MPPAKGRKIAASRKKKQTRLMFDPVDQTSSPAPSGPSPAKVRYAKPSTSRSTRTIPSSSVEYDSESDDPIISSAVPARSTPAAKSAPRKNGKLPFKKGPLPTPLKSSQMPGGGNISSGTLEDSEDEIANTTFPARPTRSSAPKPFSAKIPTAKKSGIQVDGGSSDGSVPEEHVRTPSKTKKSKGKASKPVVNITSDEEEDAPPATMNSGRSSKMEVVIMSPKSSRTTTYTPTKTKAQKGKPALLISNEDSEEEEEEEFPEVQKLATSGSIPRRDSIQEKGPVYVELSSDGEDFEVSLHQNSNMRTKKPTLFSTVPKGKSSSPIPAPDSSDHKFHSTRKMLVNGSKKLLFSNVPKDKSSSPQAEESEESQAGEEEDSDDDIIMSTQPSRRRRPAVFISDPVDNDDDEDDDVQISSPLKRRRATIESDDSDIASSPLKRKRPNPVYSEDEDDSPVPNKKTQSREATPQNRTTRQTGRRRHRTEKEKKLELLKRRRAGENIEELTESEETGSEDDSASELQELSEFEDEEQEEVVVKSKKPTPKKRQKSVANGSDEDAYDSDFIVDDDDGNLGVPMLDIPLEFTHAAHKPLKEHFKDAVEWMVHAKINPGFARDDPLYVQAFKKLDDEYGGYAKSKFVSTQWTAEFVRAIYARPEFLVRDLAPGEEMTIAGEVICQVCNHRKYVPKFEIQFAGKAYHRDSLEEVEQDDSSDDSDGASNDSHKRSVNAEGQVIPPEEKCWLSGQYCKANAEQAHSLIHWKHALNQWVLGNLEHEGYLTPDKLAEREKLKSKYRRKYANDIVDEWETHNQIKDLYRDFKINLESARNATPANFRNGRFARN